MALDGTVRPPSTNETSFNCPHCGALAKQYWFSAKADSLKHDSHPNWMARKEYDDLLAKIEDQEVRERQARFIDRLNSQRPFFREKDESAYVRLVCNVHFSQCYNCSEISVWFGQGLAWPTRGAVDRPNLDMPAEALRDYEEASQIVDQSPRGAAALLRLAIQRICIELGGDGKNLNKDIAKLVDKGLDPRVQKALDIVRVVGNNAVHPGEMDIKDDKNTAEKLFALVNLIVDIMISQPKHVGQIFDGLPTGALTAITERDGKTD